jgi:hypothetical protein
MGIEVVTELNTSDAFVGKITEPKYHSVETDTEGVFIRAEVGQYPEVSAINLGTLCTQGRMLATIDTSITALKKQRNTVEGKLVEVARSNEGVRGVQSDKDKISVAIFPKVTIDGINAPALRRALGPNYSTAVREEVQANISVPLGRETPRGPLNSKMMGTTIINSLVAELGFTLAQAKKLVRIQLNLEIEESTIGLLITDGKAKIGSTVASVSEVWEAKPRALLKPPARKITN